MTADPWAIFDTVFPQAKPEPVRTTPTVYRPTTAGSSYAQAALEAECQRVVDAPAGSRNHTLNAAAFSLGQLVAGGALVEEDVVHGLTLAAVQAGLDDAEIAPTIRSGLLGGAKEPRGVPAQPDVDDWLSQAAAAAPPTVDPETGEVLPPDLHALRVQGALAELRVKHDAQVAHRAELAAKTFREPPYRSSLTAELLVPDEPIQYAITDLLPVGGNALLAAQYKTGKTTVVGDLARAYADGTPFLGQFHVDPGPGTFAIWNYELSETQYRRWLRELGIVNTDRVVVLHLRGYRLPLTAPTVEDWIVDWLRAHNVTFWVPDPFARAAVGTDENSNTEVGVWLDTLDVIKERAGVRDLVLPTHTGRTEQEHGQERARGATRLDDWADVRWILTKDKNDNRFFRATGRDVEVDEAALTYDVDSRRLSYGGGDRKWIADRDTDRTLLAWITQNPGRATRYVLASGGSKPANGAALGRLVAGGYVRQEDGPNNSDLCFPTGKELS